MTGKTPPLLTWVWDDAERGLCTNRNSCYFSSIKTISVTSLFLDPDEYDDLVLLHEYGHFFQHEFSRKDDRGGAHSSDTRVSPPLAWAEGSATFFGNTVRQTTMYVDTGAEGIIKIVRSIEKLPDEVPPGTSDNKRTGDLSQALVTGIMWDLADPEDANLDGWFCKGLDNRGGIFSGVEGIVNTLHGFPYDYADVGPCR